MNFSAPSFDHSSGPSKPPRRQKRKTSRVILAILFGSLFANMIQCSSQSGVDGAVEEFPNLSETLACGTGEAEGKAILIRFNGPIFREGSGGIFGSSIDPVSMALMEIQAATVDPSVKGIVLELDTPGGGVTASDELYHALLRFKEENPNRKIVVLMKDVCASGGYYMAMAGDELIAQPTSIVGSIGVLISAMNFNELSTMLGVQDVTLTSSENKALLNPLRPVNREHQVILQNVVDEMYQRFRGLVLEARPFDAAHADENKLLDGRILTMPGAMELGLVDGQGYAEDARAALEDLVDQSLDFYTYGIPGGALGALLGVDGPVETPQVNLNLRPKTQLLYYWQP